jgi:signal transduction histidine kinase
MPMTSFAEVPDFLPIAGMPQQAEQAAGGDIADLDLAHDVPLSSQAVNEVAGQVLAGEARQVTEEAVPSAGPGPLDHAEVSGDARLIERLVSNLIDNAIRYNITGGRVGITLAASTTEATLTVTNTGPLIQPDEVSHLPEPFRRAGPDRTASPDGLGLGLSIVAQIAEAHGADLQIRSEPEGGLTVTVRFPALPRASKADGTNAKVLSPSREEGSAHANAG